VSYLIKHLELGLNTLNVHVVDLDGPFDLSLPGDSSTRRTAYYMQDSLFLLSPLLKLVSFHPQKVIFLGLTHVTAFQDFVDLSLIEEGVVPLDLAAILLSLGFEFL